MTLVCWFDHEGTKLFLLPDDVSSPYLDLDGTYINYSEDQDKLDRVEHLSYMLGTEAYYGRGSVPPLGEWLETEAVKEEREGSLLAPPEPPWAKYQLQIGPAGECELRDIHRVIRCGWMP